MGTKKIFAEINLKKLSLEYKANSLEYISRARFTLFVIEVNLGFIGLEKLFDPNFESRKGELSISSNSLTVSFFSSALYCYRVMIRLYRRNRSFSCFIVDCRCTSVVLVSWAEIFFPGGLFNLWF